MKIEEVLKNAGKILVSDFKKYHEVRIKKDGSLLTDTDLKIEKFLIERIESMFPNYNIVSEECGKLNKGSNYTWIIDPLDGTTNFSIGVPFFNISLCLIKNSIPIEAFIYSPITDELFHAKKDCGAWLNREKIVVSKTDKLSDSILCYCRNKVYMERFMRVFVVLKPLCRDLNRLRSAELELSLVASGRIDGFFYTASKNKVWDVIAGALMVKEAGGKVTDFDGNKWKIDSEDLLATNGKIHNEVLNIISESV